MEAIGFPETSVLTYETMCITDHIGKTVKLQVCIRKVLCSNLGRVTVYPDRLSRLSSALPGK
jgi:hypothetical protein